MKVVEIKHKNILNDFLLKQENPEFLQSWEWGEFQEKSNLEILRYGVDIDGEIVAVLTLIKKKIVGNFFYFYSPRGPVFAQSQPEVVDFLFEEIKKIARKEGCLFLRFEPSAGVKNQKLKIEQTIDLQPSKTLILNLKKTEEELLANMHQKTRYNIKLAVKKGVDVQEFDVSNFDAFWNLMNQTSKRDQFRLHSKKYYQDMLQTLSGFVGDKLSVRLFVAKLADRILSANIIVFFDGTATYLHGSSSNEKRNVMAPYLLQWEVIKIAKKMGCKRYDFFGVDEEKWPGVTKFKNGFCDKNLEECTVNYPGTYDLIFNCFKYALYKFFRTLKRIF